MTNHRKWQKMIANGKWCPVCGHIFEVTPAIMLHLSVDTYCLCGQTPHQLNVMLGKVFHRKVLYHHHHDGQLSGRVGGGGGG